MSHNFGITIDLDTTVYTPEDVDEIILHLEKLKESLKKQETFIGTMYGPRGKYELYIVEDNERELRWEQAMEYGSLPNLGGLALPNLGELAFIDDQNTYFKDGKPQGAYWTSEEADLTQAYVWWFHYRCRNIVCKSSKRKVMTVRREYI